MSDRSPEVSGSSDLHHEGNNKSRLVLGEQQRSRDLGEHVSGVEQTDPSALRRSADDQMQIYRGASVKLRTQ